MTRMIRMIAFETCADTGARYIADIVEIDNVSHSVKFLCAMAADYTHSGTSVPVYTMCDPNEPTRNVTLDDINTGKARLLKSRIHKMLEQL
jgi:hypothetical protein